MYLCIHTNKAARDASETLTGSKALNVFFMYQYEENRNEIKRRKGREREGNKNYRIRRNQRTTHARATTIDVNEYVSYVVLCVMSRLAYNVNFSLWNKMFIAVNVAYTICFIFLLLYRKFSKWNHLKVKLSRTFITHRTTANAIN